MRESFRLLPWLLLASVAHSQTPMIYDDDGPVQDVGAVQNFGVFYKMVDHNWIKPLATIADSGNGLSAPGIHALAVYYRHTEIPIGANQQNTPDSAGCKASDCIANDWNAAWVAKFDPVSGDTRTNYQDCRVLYRKTLAAQPDHSAVIVETGFATCLMQLLNSSADSYSPLAGTQLAKNKVKYLVIMGGDYPTGEEWNFTMDSSNYSALFSTWKSQNGYPPLYLVVFKLGMIASSGAPADAPVDKNPIRNANHWSVPTWQVGHRDGGGGVSGETRQVWDQMAIMYGTWGTSHAGTTYFSVSPGGTNTVDRSKGTNVWDASIDSGHHYLTANASSEAFAEFLDGYSHRGLLAEPPRGASGDMKQ
jgi:purine nucleosidase